MSTLYFFFCIDEFKNSSTKHIFEKNVIMYQLSYSMSDFYSLIWYLSTEMQSYHRGGGFVRNFAVKNKMCSNEKAGKFGPHPTKNKSKIIHYPNL